MHDRYRTYLECFAWGCLGGWRRIDSGCIQPDMLVRSPMERHDALWGLCSSLTVSGRGVVR
eukprot:6944837-Alexandrium_andersonii.AAC.1